MLGQSSPWPAAWPLGSTHVHTLQDAQISKSVLRYISSSSHLDLKHTLILFFILLLCCMIKVFNCTCEEKKPKWIT